ncbi:mannose-1-phosphate guanylyltransferase [Candidatus Parcubacteria bacterium]|jgi:mannose-1-phosphate guanylyltransferase|nr:mannose-1-phosphate guanylyltransferase [Candidatus Parcubacteria bacterium]MBT3948458.1 mannose-1-phosphate guanylyltransferase [Candidatus Parcubacteria bacterium]
MNILIFAGGAGTRLWPLSRQESPKQFEVLKDDKSTLQMAVDRIEEFGFKNIYVSTNNRYTNMVRGQVPEIPVQNILGEPAKRDLAAAVGLALMRLKKQGVTGTVAMLWADHFMDKPGNFREALHRAEELIEQDPNRFVFLGEQPRFANHNLGWIHLGDNIESGLHKFKEWKYRPELLECQEMFESRQWMWNPGYFVFDIDFVLGLYKEHQPKMYIALEDMVNGNSDLDEEYPKLEAISFDNAIVEKVSADQAVVLKVDLGWSDPGTLYALKEALVNSPDKNFEKGNVVDLESTDCFMLNEEDKKIVTTIGLKGMVVVNTKDALLVCHKDDVPKVKALLKKVEDKGLGKYL